MATSLGWIRSLRGIIPPSPRPLSPRVKGRKSTGVKLANGNGSLTRENSWRAGNEHARVETCEAHVGQTVVLNGWVNSYRAYNDQIFVDLRDRYGITQVVFEADDKDFPLAQEIRNEFVLSVQGAVRERLPGKHNPKLATGDIEVKAHELTILNRCPTPPFEVTEFPGEELANEDLRLQYRYLDLRRVSIQRVLMLRHRLNQVIRANLDKQGFLEVEARRPGPAARRRDCDYFDAEPVTSG